MQKILLIPALLLLLISCTSEDTVTEADNRIRSGLLILEDGGTQDSIMAILGSAGFEPELGGDYWLYTGDDIGQFRAIIILNGVVWNWAIPDSVQEKIRDFVQDGDVLITTEWISWSGAFNDMIINDVIPVYYDDFWRNGAETYYRQINHALTAGLPDTFLVPDDWSYSGTKVDSAPAKQAQLLIEGSQSGAALVIGKYGSGTTIHWNMGGHYNGTDIWSTEVRRLLINIADFALNVAANP